MCLIQFEAISKSFLVSKRSEGLRASFRHFFRRETTTVHALKEVSFDIEAGELVGYIGPNGAGKSTTVKIMSGILTPSSGRCTIGGKVPWKERKAHVRDIGVVFGQRSQLWWDVPVVDSFELLKSIYEVPKRDYREMLSALTEALCLTEFLETPVRQLSLGQRMRCELAASLLHNPPVLFLDEPTIGLDAISKVAVRSFIKEINRKFNTTVILTTHDMADIEALCDRVIVIGKGEKLFDGTLKNLRRLVTTERRVIVDFTSLPEGIPHVVGTRVAASEGNRVEYRFVMDEVKSSEIIRELTQGHDIEDLLVEDIPIEEIITRLYEVMAI